MSSQQRSAVVTGASSGIGRAITRALREEGFAVTMVGRDPAKLAAAAEADEGDAGEGLAPATVMAGSVADEGFLDEIVEFHSGTHGALDLLVNSAGIAGNRAVGDITADFLDAQLAVNTRAVVLLTAKCLPLLKSAVALRNSAQVVNIASNAGKRGEATLSSYSATKAAVIGFTEALHDELATSGIKATAVCPGLVDTPMADAYRGAIAASTMISPADVAEVVRMTTRLSTVCIVPEIVLLRPTEWLQPEEVRSLG
ncbi:SDR family NAD(P)-dependent oxidoreductase [Mycolicibacterium moriokaense]|nr:SDR family NAD(P)-dependent oxidoreductase [Mycolicibacterium moriokaense]